MVASNLIYSMGSNLNGQLGINDPDIKIKNSPILVETLMDKKPIAISCGANHTAICTEDGEVYSWGQGRYGALGILSTTDQFTPVFVRFPDARNTMITDISCGQKHTAFIDNSGRVFTTGNNEVGQLGQGTREQENVPVQVRKFNEKIKGIASGQLHTLMLTRAGLVYACGANSFGQLGLGSKRGTNVPTLIIDITHIPMKKVAAGGFSGSISMDSGDLYLWGSGVFGEFLTPHRVKTIHGSTVDVSIGNHFGTAINKSGGIYTWGINNSGELGQGDLEERATPQLIMALQDRFVTSVSCGRNFTIALGQTLKNGDIDNQFKQRNINESHSPLRKDQVGPLKGIMNKSQINEYVDTSGNESYNSKTNAVSKSKKRSSRGSKQFKMPQKVVAEIDSNTYTPFRTSPLRSKSQIHKQCDSHCSRCHHSPCDKHVKNPVTKKVKSKSKSKTKSKSDIEEIVQKETLYQESQYQIEKISEFNKQLREEQDKDKEIIRMLRIEKQNAEDGLWKERNQRKVFENEISELRQKLKEQSSKNSELQNINHMLELQKGDQERLIQLEMEYQRSQQHNRDLQQEIKTVNGKYHELESRFEKMYQIESDCQRYQAYCKDLQNEVRVNKSRINDLEMQQENNKSDLQQYEQMITQYDKNLSEIEIQFQKRELENDSLKQQTISLKEQLTQERENNGRYQVMLVQVEEEINKRKNAERELDKLRNDIYQQRAGFNQDQDNLKRALDDLRYQNEDNIKTIHLKDEEIRFLQKDVMAWKEIIDKGSDEVAQLKQIIADLEDKNRKLNEKLNEVIYNKASAYKQRTLQALRRGESPERLERAQEYGLAHPSGQRLDQVIEDEKMTTEKALHEMSRLMRNQSPDKRGVHQDATSNYKVYQELQRIEDSDFKSHQQRSPFQNNQQHELLGMSGFDDKEGLRREDLNSSGPHGGDSFNQAYPNMYQQHYRSGSTNANSHMLQNSSPLRQKEIEQQQNTQIAYQLKSQTPQKPYYSAAVLNHQERIKNSCEKLASTLGIQKSDDNKSNDYQMNSTTHQHHSKYLSSAGGMKHSGSQNGFDSSRDDNQQIINQSATIMTSSLIKKSLHDLRMRLESVKRDKNVVESGMNDYENKNYNNS